MSLTVRRNNNVPNRINPTTVYRMLQQAQRVYRAAQNIQQAQRRNNAVEQRRWSNTPSISSNAYSEIPLDTPMGGSTPYRKKMGLSTGFYKGKFAKPRKLKPNAEDKALRSGYHMTRETFGIVEDDHCCYIAHNTFTLPEFVKCMVGASIRELFKLHGYPINNRSQTLLSAFGTPDAFRIRVTQFNDITAVEGAATYDITATQSLTDVVTAFTGFRDIFLNYLNNYNVDKPFRLTLLIPDGPAPYTYRTVANMDLNHMVFTLDVESQICIQNRTLGANAGTGDADRVDNQPVVGRMYQFRHGEPRMQQPDVGASVALNSIQETGLKLFKSTVLGVAFQEPPTPKFWSNCNKSTTIRLNPGEIKKSLLYHTYKGTLATLAKKLTIRNSAVGTRQMTGVPGKCQLFALEEKIRTNSDNKLTINYERQIKVGCVIKKARTTSAFVTELETQNVDAV